LLKIILDTCVAKRGKLIIPSFSVGRTQEIVYVINKLHNEKKLPHIDVFVDSPLAVDATQIFRMHNECMNSNFKELLKTDPNPFGFSGLHYVKNIEESKALNFRRTPCIIISASGMLEAGRVKHHVANNISNSRNTILIVGYCAPETLGARIQKPELTKISIFGEIHKIKAKIKRIEAFSGHGDYTEMLDFLECQDKKQLKKTFLVHGEYSVQVDYREKMFENGFKRIKIPTAGEEWEL
jgi:metallo-beta-lactamase family protein